MATRELERSIAVSSFDVVEVTKIWELSKVIFTVQTRIIVFAFLSFRKILPNKLTINPLFAGKGLFLSSTFEGGLNRDGRLKREGGGLI